MPTISVFPDTSADTSTRFRAVADGTESVGATVGQAIDSLTSQLGPIEGTTLIVVQSPGPDQWFTAAQRNRLADLMSQWRAARDAGTTFPAEEQAELNALIDAELQATAARTAAMFSSNHP